MKLQQQKVDIEIDGNSSAIEDLELLIGTSSGLLLVNGKERKVTRLTSKRSVYGITRCHNGFYWFAQRDGNYIHKLDLTEEKLYLVADLRKFSPYYRQGIHQIDFIGSELFVMDTYNNRCLVLNQLDKFRIVRIIYPNGLNSGNSKSDLLLYGHFNSIYSFGPNLFMLAHNDTVRTKRPSELYIFNKSTGEFLDKIRDIGLASHNIAFCSDNILYTCDSRRRSLNRFVDEVPNPIFIDDKYKTYTRGLSINDDTIIVGGSLRSSCNEKTNGYLFILDKYNYSLLCTIEMKEVGQVHEVRSTGLDYGYSNTWRDL